MQILPLAGLIDPEGAVLAVITALFDAGPEQVPLKIVTVYVPGDVAI